MKISEIWFKELKSTGNFEHVELGIRVQVSETDKAKDVLESMKAFVTVNSTPSISERVLAAQSNIEKISDKNDFNYRESIRVLEKYKPLIELAQKLD